MKLDCIAVLYGTFPCSTLFRGGFGAPPPPRAAPFSSLRFFALPPLYAATLHLFELLFVGVADTLCKPLLPLAAVWHGCHDVFFLRRDDV
jgi:hypothetical protein